MLLRRLEVNQCIIFCSSVRLNGRWEMVNEMVVRRIWDGRWDEMVDEMVDGETDIVKF